MQRCSIFVSKSNFVFWRTREVLRVLIKSTISRRNLLPHRFSSWSEKFFTFLIKFWIYREKNCYFIDIKVHIKLKNRFFLWTMKFPISWIVFRNIIVCTKCQNDFVEMSVFELVNIRYCQMFCGKITNVASCRVALHYVASRHLASSRITSHRVASCCIASHYVASRRVTQVLKMAG